VIPDETLERVRDAADIVQIISETVKLKRTGHDFRGPCPFHQGKGPNFSVAPAKGMYYCFVCHESGDVFKFVQKKLGMDWPSAVKYVGERSGIEVIDAPTRPKVADPNAKHWEVLASAAQWFRAQLQDATIGRDALRYLTERGLDASAIEQFELGYAPRDEQLLRSHLHSLGFDDPRQIGAGILKPAADGREARMNFRDRVMFPIVDERGNYVGFGGRALGDAIPKYLNSAASDVYQKGRTLYGLHAARHAIRRERSAIVVEGYMDAIRVALAGYETVVAPLGTALTEEQAALLVRYAPEVFLLYDSDKAGLEATFRSGLELLRHGAGVRVVTLPDGDDPDTFTRAKGRAGLETLLTNAMDVFDRQIQILERRGAFTDLSHRRKAIDKLLPTVRAAKDALTREMYLTRLAEVTHLDKAILLREANEPEMVSRKPSGRASGSAGSTRASRSLPDSADPGPDAAGAAPHRAPWTPRPPGSPWKGRNGRPTAPDWRSSHASPTGRIEEPAERALISAMLADRSLVEVVSARHPPASFQDVRYRELFRVLLVAHADEGLDEIADRIDEETAAVLRELAHRRDGHHAEAVDVTLNLKKLDARIIDARLVDIRQEMGEAEARHDAERVEALSLQQQQLIKERNVLLPMRSPRGKPRY